MTTIQAETTVGGVRHKSRTVPGEAANARTPGDRERRVLAQAGIAALRTFLDEDRATNIGFPSTFDIDYTDLFPLFNHVLNNVGDPFTTSAFPANTKHLEREVISTFADLLRAPADDRWGYVTNGGTEGNEYGLLLARTLYPDGVVYYSTAAHYSLPKIVAKLRMPAIALRADARGVLDDDDLRHALRVHRDKPAIVVATIGTTMTEAIDDVGLIRAALADTPIHRTHIHADAALSGLPLALLPPQDRPRFDLADGADSISVSGHKFLGSPFPCGIVLTRRTLKDRIGQPVDYVATTDTTLSGSRSGHAALILWYALTIHGEHGLRDRAHHARQVAAYTVTRLTQIGWKAWRHPHAMTVVLAAVPEAIARRWRLATSGTHSHIICMPGITTAQIDAVCTDLATVTGTPPSPPAARRHIPAPRPAAPPRDRSQP